MPAATRGNQCPEGPGAQLMSGISENDWELIRRRFGDLAYEHPELHPSMLEIIEAEDPPETSDDLK